MDHSLDQNVGSKLHPSCDIAGSLTPLSLFPTAEDQRRGVTPGHGGSHQAPCAQLMCELFAGGLVIHHPGVGGDDRPLQWAARTLPALQV